MLKNTLKKKKKKPRFEISTHSKPKDEIERGYEEGREGSSIPIYIPPSFRIVRIIAR